VQHRNIDALTASANRSFPRYEGAHSGLELYPGFCTLNEGAFHMKITTTSNPLGAYLKQFQAHLWLSRRIPM
jgi:hypothetical protein